MCKRSRQESCVVPGPEPGAAVDPAGLPSTPGNRRSRSPRSPRSTPDGRASGSTDIGSSRCGRCRQNARNSRRRRHLPRPTVQRCSRRYPAEPPVECPFTFIIRLFSPPAHQIRMRTSGWYREASDASSEVAGLVANGGARHGAHRRTDRLRCGERSLASHRRCTDKRVLNHPV